MKATSQHSLYFSLIAFPSSQVVCGLLMVLVHIYNVTVEQYQKSSQDVKTQNASLFDSSLPRLKSTMKPIEP